MSFGETTEKYGPVCCCCSSVGLLLMLILLPLSFSYVEYYQFGLVQRKSTSAVRTDKVYDAGRYNLGPDYTFKTYQADAHFVDLNELSVFSQGQTNNSIGLEFKIDVTITYFLKQNKIGTLHEDLADGYRNVIEARLREGIKNEAIYVEFTEYFQERDKVEQRLAKAAKNRLAAPPDLFATLDQFILGRVQIPDSVANKQLDVKIQLERNAMQSNLKRAQLERDVTSVEVNKINLQADYALRIADANAKLLQEQGKAEAKRIVDAARYNGYKTLYDACGITSAKHKASFDYIRTLNRRADVSGADLAVTYIDNHVVQHTTPSPAPSSG